MNSLCNIDIQCNLSHNLQSVTTHYDLGCQIFMTSAYAYYMDPYKWASQALPTDQAIDPSWPMQYKVIYPKLLTAI